MTRERTAFIQALSVRLCDPSTTQVVFTKTEERKRANAERQCPPRAAQSTRGTNRIALTLKAGERQFDKYYKQQQPPPSPQRHFRNDESGLRTGPRHRPAVGAERPHSPPSALPRLRREPLPPARHGRLAAARQPISGARRPFAPSPLGILHQ